MSARTVPELKMTPSAWVTVNPTSQGFSESVGWEKMRGIEHRPLYTAEQVHAAIRQAVEAEREASADVCDQRAQDSTVSNHRRCDAAMLARSIRARGQA